MLKRILIPTDGSAHADKAIDFGCELAQKFESQIVFLHVLMHTASAEDLAGMPGVGDDVADQLPETVAVPAAGIMGAAPITVVPPESLQKIGEAILERAKGKATEAGIVGTVLKFRDGDTAKAIVETAAEEEADTIVMGRRGLSRIESLLQGSVSERVGRMAECTCITVH